MPVEYISVILKWTAEKKESHTRTGAAFVPARPARRTKVKMVSRVILPESDPFVV